MLSEEHSLKLPQYKTFMASIESLTLTVSVSELHGLLCGYLCAGQDDQGESYIRAVLNTKKNSKHKEAILSLFSLYSISQQQITNFDLGFALLLPDDDEPLLDRAQAFSAWCEGFTHGLTMAGIEINDLQEEEAQETLHHLIEFGQLDCDSLAMDEDDERALMEVTEYARMAVIGLHGDMVRKKGRYNTLDKAH